MLPRGADLTGMTFGRLTVLGREALSERHVKWRVRCSCGTQKTVAGDHLRNGSTQSCGCLQRDLTSSRATTHGATKGATETPEYRVWKAMIRRCQNPNAKGFSRYGGRGIDVCERWRQSFESFLEDMGLRPSPEHSIERKDNSGQYEPGNCVWATRKEQQRNKRSNVRLTFNGVTATLQDWAERTGIGRSTIQFRLKQGWSIEKALTTPGGRKSKLNADQRAEIGALVASGLGYREIAERFGVTTARVSQIVLEPTRAKRPAPSAEVAA